MTTPNNTVTGLAEKLLPCPFCGETPAMENIRADEDQGTKWGSVVCGCGIVGPEVRTGYEPVEKWADRAIEEWNRRASPAPSVSPAYDRELIAEMLGELFYDDGEKLRTRSRWTAEAIAEQARLLREADNADAANVGTVSVPPSVAGDAGGLPELQRYGRGPKESPYLLVPMNDGYWTPWHIAQDTIRRLATPEQPGSAVQGAAVAQIIARIQIAIEHGDRHGWSTARNELLGIVESDYTTPPPAPAAKDRIEAMRGALDKAAKAVSGPEAPMPTVPELAARLRQKTAPAAEQGYDLRARGRDWAHNNAVTTEVLKHGDWPDKPTSHQFYGMVIREHYRLLQSYATQPEARGVDGMPDEMEAFQSAMEAVRGYRPQLLATGTLMNGRDADRFDGWQLAMRLRADAEFQVHQRVVWTSKFGNKYAGAIRHINPPSPLTYYVDLDHGTSIEAAQAHELTAALGENEVSRG